MEVVTFAKEVAQSIAEQAASYRLGQSALRQLDRALWVVEKCARWAVPPPLDQDERPQPELVRPLPWVLFLALLVTLRVTREALSLVFLVLGKPPVRSADVVMYIQSKRRYLRTLKYQGNRLIRARGAQPQAPAEPWPRGLRALFDFTMCFRRSHYGNNNTTRLSHNDEVLVVKRSKRGREAAAAAAAAAGDPMERLIEKMMVDLDASSEDDSSFTLTNANSVRSDSETEQYTTESRNEMQTLDTETSPHQQETNSATESGQATSSSSTEHENNDSPSKIPLARVATPEKPPETEKVEENSPKNKSELSELTNSESQDSNPVGRGPPSPKNHSPKEDAKAFIQGERSPQKLSPKSTKMANGRAGNASAKRKGLHPQRREGDPRPAAEDAM